MCDFFSFVTIPAEKKYLYFDWKQRQAMKFKNCDSHRHILEHYKVDTDAFNCYEYNPLTKEFTVDGINTVDDSKQAEEWVEGLDWKAIIEPLIIKPIVNPFELPEATVTPEDIELLKLWASVRASVRDSVRASVRASVWAYIGSFFDIEYKYDFSPAVKLWERGLVASFDGTTWRLHTGKNAKIVYLKSDYENRKTE